ncbi:MAG TPA: UDP-N-acetylmuramoyl-L-alanine--D-glutamate ligase, partial [Flammeovirgaceae bacterium]|nr:UDP-N-acetylmuramoyl-L-alanine--D-glutamate ligase [Flammeovirgaceae bacterium]
MKQKITILGSGESGTGAALLAQSLGYEVWVSEGAVIKLAYRKELQEQGIAYEEGGHSRDKALAADCIIKSPGISPQMRLLQEAAQRGIEIIGEVEFAARYTNRPIIGITGSNGKTTTSLLTHHLLKEAGRRAVLA